MHDGVTVGFGYEVRIRQVEHFLTCRYYDVSLCHGSSRQYSD